MDIASIDYVSQALSRVTQQYKDKPKFMELVGEYARLVQENLEEPASEILNILDIDLMGGANLDVIGDIVGQSRVLVDYDLLTFFGYDGSLASGTYGDLNDSSVGDRYVSSFEDSAGEKILSDPEYRIFIKAKILKNYSDSTESDLAESIKLLLGADQVKIDEGVMSLDIGILGSISANDLALIQNYDIIPRPTGVEIASVYSYGLAEFNGATTQIDFASTTDFDIGSSDFEIRAKVKTAQPNQTIISKEDDANGASASYMLYIKNGTARFGYSAVDGTLIEFDSGFDVSDNLVHSISVKRESSVLSINVDGGASYHAISSSPLAGTADFLKIGKSDTAIPTEINVAGGSQPYHGIYYFAGFVNSRPYWAKTYADRFGNTYAVSYVYYQIAFGGDWVVAQSLSSEDVYYYSSSTDYLPVKDGYSVELGALPAATIEYGAGEFSGLIFDTSITIAGAQKGKWLLTEGTGTTATDTSGNGNDGTITDGTWATSSN